jgi:hypothetical protein
VINANQGEDGFVLRYEENKRTGSYVNQASNHNVNNHPIFRPFTGNLGGGVGAGANTM